MTRTILALCSLGAIAVGAGGGVAACSSSSSNGGSGSDAGSGVGGDGAVDAGVGSFLPEIPCTDSVDSVYADPGDVSGKSNGAILKCAKDKDLSIADLTAAVDVANGGNMAYGGAAFTSGAHVYRLLYKTTRGDAAGSPGYSSALLLLPETPRLGDGKPLPVIVASHGSRGQAAHCAPSLDDPAAAYVEEDFQHLVYPLVGLGFAVIAPDNAGYANYGAPGNPPPVYDSVTDVGRSVLDGARAIRYVVPHSVDNELVLIGHSQGGYTTLAALSQADTYAADSIIKAVAVYSPLWVSQRTWGAVFADQTDYALDKSNVGVVSIWYHYTHAFLLDGPDAALEVFNPAVAGVVQKFVQNDCWSATYPDLLEAGATANDFFTSSYIASIEPGALPPAALGTGCTPGDAVCAKWLGRMTDDYPHLTGGAAKVPILLFYGNDDQTITPDGMQCVFNRLTGDNANYQICYDTNPVGHSGVVAANASYVVDWIAQQTIPDAGAPHGGNCTSLAPNDAGVPQLLTSDGGAQACNKYISTQ
jgi:alpha-beta hydrolase superfamily lysophospholipase